MKAVVQRVECASVLVNETVVGRIGPGLLVYLAVVRGDSDREARRLASKVSALRIFPGSSRNMDRSVVDVAGGLLVISQFTLAARTERGNRPNFGDAASGADAEALYRVFLEGLRAFCLDVQSGTFGAMMKVSSVNDGPVTIPLEVLSPKT